MFNDAFAVGGPLCTVKTVEHLTDVRIDHFVVVDFNGFKKVVDALGGVQVCVPHEVNDTTGHIYLPAGTYNVKGERALDYVRVRHDLGVPNGDIGRLKRQQAFLASMTNKAISAGTLANPVRLYNFLDAATKSLTTDPGLASLSKLAGLAKSLKGIGLQHNQFLTVPFQEYAPDPNRLQWAPQAKKLWSRIRNDEPVGKKFGQVTTAAQHAGKPSKKKSSSPSPSPSRTAAARAAEENGLCA
jgi:LCP family protein required for cell wall assembly